MDPQWAETDPQSLSKIKIRKAMPENTHGEYTHGVRSRIG